MDMTINQRLAKFLYEKEIKQEQLRVKLGIKNRQQISNWINNRDPIPDKYQLQIIRLYPILNANWFIHEIGEPYVDQKVLRQVNRNEYGFCEDCMDKDKEIEALNIQLATKDKEVKELCKEIGKLEGRIEMYEKETQEKKSKKK